MDRWNWLSARELACLFTKQTKMKVYFANPQCPWERGTNENTNGLLPVLSGWHAVHQVSRREIKGVQAILNDRPRKILNWHSPAHVFHQLLH
jgi:transposase, IS30 family